MYLRSASACALNRVGDTWLAENAFPVFGSVIVNGFPDD
jgi:hypothetical protein